MPESFIGFDFHKKFCVFTELDSSGHWNGYIIERYVGAVLK